VNLDRFNSRHCVILVPYYGSIVPECDDALRELERRGYTVRRIGGYAAIDSSSTCAYTYDNANRVPAWPTRSQSISAAGGAANPRITRYV
jgi:hypothetical protein